jgi:hypothetical protein
MDSLMLVVCGEGGRREGRGREKGRERSPLGTEERGEMITPGRTVRWWTQLCNHLFM